MSGKYAIVRLLSAGWPHYEVWNGNNNHRLTPDNFVSEKAAREWAEENGFTIRETARSRMDARLTEPGGSR